MCVCMYVCVCGPRCLVAPPATHAEASRQTGRAGKEEKPVGVGQQAERQSRQKPAGKQAYTCRESQQAKGQKPAGKEAEASRHMPAG